MLLAVILLFCNNLVVSAKIQKTIQYLCAFISDNYTLFLFCVSVIKVITVAALEIVEGNDGY